jgi:two-component system NtrC family sensor kinase
MPKAKLRWLSGLAPLEIFRRFARQSLAVKLMTTTSLVFCLIVMLAAAAMMGMVNKAIAETSVTTALYQTQLLKIKLIESMVNENERHEELAAMLAKVKSLGQMDEVNIFNDDGEIRFSSVSGNIGRQIDMEPDRRERLTPDDAVIRFFQERSEDRLRIVHPIRGGKQCIACHESKNGIIGGIELFVPLQPIYARFSRNSGYFLMLAFLSAVLGAIVIRWLVHTIVRQPVRKLIGVMERAKTGELDVRTRMHEDPDLRRLAKSFNAMVRGIREAQELVHTQHREELSQSNRLASLGQLISNVSHEIKNPLAAMSSALHALRSEFDAKTEQEIFQELARQITRIEQTVNNLLRYARQAPPKNERFSIGSLMSGPLQHAIDLAQHRFTANRISVKVLREREDVGIVADNGQLQQVFLNLFLNAAAAMPRGGTLTVTLRPTQRTDADFSKGLEIEVRDTGIGIPPENIARVFEPFYTTTENGTGLGLSVVRGIVEGAEGKIQIESAVGEGTCVTVFFPSADKGYLLEEAVQKQGGRP